MMKKITDFIDPNLLPFSEIVRKIRDKEHFTFARFGDGEFEAILGFEGENCDGHQYSEDLGIQLDAAFMVMFHRSLSWGQNAYVGIHQMMPTEKKRSEKRIAVHAGTVGYLLGIRSNRHTKGDFAQNGVFHVALRDGYMPELFTALKDRDVLIIGPDFIEQAGGAAGALIQWCDLIPIPHRNAYNYTGKLYEELKGRDLTGKVVLICAGPAAPLWCANLCHEYGNSATFIDFGSTFDPYCGKNSRSYHQKSKLNG